MVRSFGEHTYAEDLVQETYVRLHNSDAKNKVVVNGQPNKAFMYIALRNNYITYKRELSKGHKVSIEKVKPIASADDNIKSRYIANDNLDRKVEQEMNEWHWYDRELFKLYITSGKSMRKLASDTNISLSSIANTIKNCKTKIREALSEDWQDYINKDYDKI